MHAQSQQQQHQRAQYTERRRRHDSKRESQRRNSKRPRRHRSNRLETSCPSVATPHRHSFSSHSRRTNRFTSHSSHAGVFSHASFSSHANHSYPSYRESLQEAMRMAARASNCVTRYDLPSVDLAHESLHTLMDEAFGGKTLAHVVTREDLFVHGRYDVDYQDAGAREDYGPDDLYTPYCPTSQSLSDCSGEIDALFDDVLDDSDLDNEIELACRELGLNASVSTPPPLPEASNMPSELARVSDLSYDHHDNPKLPSMLDNSEQSEVSSSPAYIPQSPCSATFSFDNYIISAPQQQ